MEYGIIVILLALIQYAIFTLKTGTSRPKLEVHAPKISGNDMWERLFRIQQNTLEQLIVFVPGVLIFSYYVSEVWVLVPGVVYLVGRQIFAAAYIKAPETRTLGFALTFFSNAGLILVSLGFIVSTLL